MSWSYGQAAALHFKTSGHANEGQSESCASCPVQNIQTSDFGMQKWWAFPIACHILPFLAITKATSLSLRKRLLNIATCRDSAQRHRPRQAVDEGSRASVQWRVPRDTHARNRSILVSHERDEDRPTTIVSPALVRLKTQKSRCSGAGHVALIDTAVNDTFDSHICKDRFFMSLPLVYSFRGARCDQGL